MIDGERKTILCYGDSNTWGWPPGGMGRYPASQRWPGVLGIELGDGFHIIEAGQPGRSLRSNFSLGGEEHAELFKYLDSDDGIDLVIIMLGANDVISRPAQSSAEITADLEVLMSRILSRRGAREGEKPKAMIISPPHLEVDSMERFGSFDDILVRKSKELSEHYRRVAQDLGCAFFDAAQVICSSPMDGVHLEAGAHVVLGQTLAPKCRVLFN